MLIDSAVFAAGTVADQVPERACRQVRTVGSSARYRWLKTMGRIAGSSLAHLDRRKAPRDAVEVGDIIRLSGSPSNRRRNNVIAHTMFNPYPVEFVQLDDGNILLRIEEHDNERLIHMSGDVDPVSQPPSRQGFSVGRWEDPRTLVVETSRVSFGWLNQDGIPQSEDSTIVERFELNEAGDGIAYGITLTDPETFTQPVMGRAQWVAVPGIRIRPFAMYCEDGFYED